MIVGNIKNNLTADDLPRDATAEYDKYMQAGMRDKESGWRGKTI